MQRSFQLISLVAVLSIATQLPAADPVPANPPARSDPAPASPPASTVNGGDPAPAGPPMRIASDPAPASPPASDPAPASPPASSEPILLIDMPSVIANDPAPAIAPGATETTPLPPMMEPAIASGKPFLGVGFRNPGNTVVTTLWSDSTAIKLGIQLGDKIVSINGSTVENLAKIRAVLNAMSVGEEVTVTIIREVDGPVSVGPMPLGASHE